MTVAATSDATIAAIIDNNVENVASTKLKPAKGQSFGAVLASNKVSSTTTAIVDDVDPVGTASSISARGSVTVRAVDNASINASLRLTSTTEASTFPNKPAEAKGYAFAVTLNDVRGDSKATIANTQVTIGVAASIVEAHETSSLIAHTLVGAETTTSGGTLQGGAERCRAERNAAGRSGTLQGGTVTGSTTVLVSTNVVQGSAEARVTSSQVAGAGSFAVTASNTSVLDSKTINATVSGGEAIGVTVSFNTIGWAAQDILFNAIDAIIGSPEIADAFDSSGRSSVTAELLDTTVAIDGNLVVDAYADATLVSVVDNRPTVETSSILTDAQGLSLGIVLSMNKISSKATASIEFTTPFDAIAPARILAGASVRVEAVDSLHGNTTLTLESNATATSNPYNGNASAKGYAIAVSLNDLRGGATALVTNAAVRPTAGSLRVLATERATLRAVTDVAANTSTSGGNILGGTAQQRVVVQAATNVLLGAALAHVTASHIETPTSNDPVQVAAATTTTLQADITTLTSSGGVGIGVTVAFNSMGWAPQNILFNVIDTLIGSRSNNR